jgi:hypothetical protein
MFKLLLRAFTEARDPEGRKAATEAYVENKNNQA